MNPAYLEDASGYKGHAGALFVPANEGELQAILREAAKLHAVDIELLKAIIAVESGFVATAVSPKGAVGLMQIMPVGATREAREAQARRLLDARHNILTGARLLSQLMRRFGRVDVALAAWNAGTGTVMKHGGGMPPIAASPAAPASRSRLLPGSGWIVPIPSAWASKSPPT